MRPRLRVLVAEDETIIRLDLCALLAANGVEVCAEARDGEEAVMLARTARPDVAILDIRMPKLDGLEATRLLVGDAGRSRVLVLTTFGLDEYVFEALRAGASGFLLKDAPPDQLLAAVHAVGRGDALLDPSVTRTVIAEFAGTRVVRSELLAKLDELTEREREVFHLLARGLSNAEIAHELFVSEGTVKTHVARVLLKLGLRDRVQAVVFAYESGAMEPTPTDAQG